MKSRCAILLLFFLFKVFLALAFLTACTGREPRPNPRERPDEASGEIAESGGPAWPVLALLKTGENPLWFELGQEGPRLIESPAAAALTPYTPWPHARFVTCMALWDGFLVMAVNRDGFLVFGASGNLAPEETGELVLYRAADSLWEPYTAESLFIWDDKPAVLLYRNDFFSELSVPLNPQVYVLDRSSSIPIAATVPALEADGFWEAEAVRRGPDGLWYYRMKEKGQGKNETAYFRTGDLAVEGEKISIGEWRNSGQPERAVPLHLTAVLDRAAELLPGGAGGAVRTVSPDFEGQRFFGSVPDSAIENLAPLVGFCREKPEPLALAMLPDGRGFYSYGEEQAARPFSLPALPEGFIYTSVALLGKVIAASWEEQQEAGIGAAGFIVILLEGVFYRL